MLALISLSNPQFFSAVSSLLVLPFYLLPRRAGSGLGFHEAWLLVLDAGAEAFFRDATALLEERLHTQLLNWMFTEVSSRATYSRHFALHQAATKSCSLPKQLLEYFLGTEPYLNLSLALG